MNPRRMPEDSDISSLPGCAWERACRGSCASSRGGGNEVARTLAFPGAAWERGNQYFTLIITIVLFILSRDCFAQIYIDPKSISPDQWELHPEGIALAHSLTAEAIDHGQGSVIHIFIKNVSSTPKIIFYESLSRGFKCFIKIYGEWKPLKAVDETDPIIHASSVAIKPGQVIDYPIDLSAVELALVKSHSVRFQVIIVDELTKKQSIIESSPSNLTVL